MNDPLVSIIIPVYNKEFYLRKVIDNIYEQDYKNWELILVDDGSTDNSKIIIDEYANKDKRITVYYQSNHGVSYTRNQGMKYAKGEWIWFIDADDIPDKTFLSKTFMSEISEKTDLIVAYYSKVFSDGKKVNIVLDEQQYIQSEELPDLFMKYQYDSGFWGYLWNKLIRRSLVVDNDLEFEESLTLAEDLNFMVSVYRKCRSLYIMPEYAMDYTVDAQNSSALKETDYLKQLKIQRKIYNWIVIQRNRAQYAPFLKRQISYYVAFCFFYGFEKGESCKQIVEKLGDSEEIFPLLNENGIDNTMRPIVRLVKKKRWLWLDVYLRGRYTIRKLYRILLRKG